MPVVRSIMRGSFKYVPGNSILSVKSSSFSFEELFNTMSRIIPILHLFRELQPSAVICRAQREGHDRIGLATIPVQDFNGNEGYGGGTARTEAYESYLKGGKSQIALATMSAPWFCEEPHQ